MNRMKKFFFLMILAGISVSILGCTPQTAPTGVDTATTTNSVDTGDASPVATQGLTAEEEKAFLRDEEVTSGFEIERENVETQLQLLEALLNKEYGQGPVGAASASDSAGGSAPSGDLPRDRDVAVIKAIQSYKKHKAAQQAATLGTPGTPAESRSPADTGK